MESREFKTITGTYQEKRITVVSTGIGCDNIDIVMNELDALANIDFETREESPVCVALSWYVSAPAAACNPTLR